GFVVNPNLTTDTNIPTFNEDWEPTESNPVKAVRGELVYKSNQQTKILTKGEALGGNIALRIWFATYKSEGATAPIGYNFKA
ncbi:hypothetical protein L0N02_20900, partial [Blautia faecis]|nr:hypothetical protein [Blautia faecis]